MKVKAKKIEVYIGYVSGSLFFLRVIHVGTKTGDEFCKVVLKIKNGSVRVPIEPMKCLYSTFLQ